jgi:hypothetical protein
MATTMATTARKPIFAVAVPPSSFVFNDRNK